MPRAKIPRLVLLSITAAAVAAAAFTSIAPSSSAGSADPAADTPKFAAIPAKVPAGTTLRVADQLGAVETPMTASGENKDFPYKVSYSSFIGGPPMLQAFQARAVDLGYIASTPAIFAQAARQGVVAVAAFATPRSTYSVLNAPGQHITSWAALKGKSVAYQEGTVQESVLLQGLQSAGLTLADIKPVNLTSTSIIPALQSGKVDAGILTQPLSSVYLAKYPQATQIPFKNAITNRSGVLIASTAALKNPAKEAAIADYISRYVKAMTWENSHVAATARAIYVDQYHVPLAEGEAIVKAAGPNAFYNLPGPLLAPQQNLANLYAQSAVIPAKENVSAEFSPLFNATVRKAAKGGS